MSESADDRGNGSGEISAREGIHRLERAVSRLLDRLGGAEARAREAEGRRAEVEELLREMTDGTADPAEMSSRLARLERENADLRRRIDEGAEGVERLLARIRFLEEKR